MIRTYRPEDKQELIQLVQSGDAMSIPVIEATLQSDVVLVYDDGKIKGCLAARRRADVCNAWVYTGPNYRGEGIGSRLWRKVNEQVTQWQPEAVTTEYNVESRDFFSRRGFQPDWSFHLMSHRGRAFDEPNLDIRQYTDGNFMDYIRIRQQAFARLTRLHDWDQEEAVDESRRQQMRDEAADIFLLYDEDTPVGLCRLHNQFMDTVAVVPGYQGYGFGKALVQFAVNRLRERGVKHPRLCVATLNKPAFGLYQKLGFQLLQTYEYGNRDIGAAN